MANFTIPEVGKIYLLKFKLGLGGADLSGAKLHLADLSTVWKANPRDQLLTDFAEMSFAGYAAQIVGAWTAVLDDATNHWAYGQSKVCVFTSTDAVNAHSIYGWYLTDAGGANLIAFADYHLLVPLPSIAPLGSFAVQIQMDELSQYNN